MLSDPSSSKQSQTNTTNREDKHYRGTSIQDICNGKGHWSFSVTPIIISKYHYVLYDAQDTLEKPPKPHRLKDVHLWDDDHVRMPFSEQNLFPITENKCDKIVERWKIINEALTQPIKTSYELEVAINKYNNSLPKFEALHYFFNEELNEEESDQFFSKLLPKIVSLALRLPELLPNGIPLLKQNHNRSMSMSQLQISCLLANAFLCTFPWKKITAATYPGVNFVGLFSASGRPERRQCICEKLKSLCHYFRRVTLNVPIGVVSFERKMIPRGNMPRWDTLTNNLGNTKIHVTSEGTIEDNGLGFLQVDFANKNIGGGVLGYGCVQEEIRFVICPELIVSRLFVEQLGKGEAVIITGAERFSSYTGYGDTFEWAGDYKDDTPLDVYNRRKTTICVIDATRFRGSKEQFHSSLMIRELNKAYVGFASREKVNLAPVATGNWGCGAFNGCKQLKTLIQLMACSAADRDLVYYSFGDEELVENFHNFHLFLGTYQITIAQLWKFLCQFSNRDLDPDNLYSFVQQAYFDSKKQPTISDFFAKANKDKVPSPSIKHKVTTLSPKGSPKTEKVEDEMMDVIIDETPPQSQSLSSSSSEDMIPSSQPERISLRKPLKPQKQAIKNKLPKTDLSRLFDQLDGNANQSKDVKSEPVSSSSNVFAFLDEFTYNKNKPPLEEVVVVCDDEKMEEKLAPKQVELKKKITDYFSNVN